MWLFTRYGFYSVVCARDLAGNPSSIDPDTVMVRARTRRHLETLQKRFPQLTAVEITDATSTDYRYRIVVAKSMWADVAQELASEIDYGNFKGRAERSSHDDRYVDALHAVWEVMKSVQQTESREE